jgi:hypothetical protein
MPKNAKMHVASRDLKNLTAFLNKDLPRSAAPSSILAEAIDAAAVKLQDTWRRLLMGLVDPESLLSVGSAPADHRERYKREIVGKWFKPQDRMEGLIRTLNNSPPLKSQWRLAPASGKKANLHLRDCVWTLQRTEVSPRDQVLSWVVRVLEGDELSRLGCCRTCQKFFIRGREWQHDCSPKCKTTYDKIIAREKREADRQKLKSKSAEAEKTELQKLVDSEGFRKRLKGGPMEKLEQQTQILNEISRAPSAPAFLQRCNPGTRRIIDAMRDDL